MSLQKGEYLFRQGDMARYFFLVQSGEIKMNNFGDDGKEFIQGIFSAGRSFGEPPLLGGFDYPANAIALENTVVWKLDKASFLELLKERPDLHLRLTQALSERLYYKSAMAPELAANHPTSLVLKLLSFLKLEIYGLEATETYEVELTRQQIADLTGLRVETVIKTIKALERDGQLRIVDRKVYL